VAGERSFDDFKPYFGFDGAAAVHVLDDDLEALCPTRFVSRLRSLGLAVKPIRQSVDIDVESAAVERGET